MCLQQGNGTVCSGSGGKTVVQCARSCVTADVWRHGALDGLRIERGQWMGGTYLSREGRKIEAANVVGKGTSSCGV